MKEVVEKYQQNALEAQPGRTIHESFEAQVGILNGFNVGDEYSVLLMGR